MKLSEPTKDILAVVAVFVVITSATFPLYTAMHESDHVQIYMKYGVNSTVQYNFFMLGGTVIPENITMPSDRYYQMMDMQALNDIIGYHFFVTMMAILSSGLLVSFTIILTNDYGEWS
jgi:hypothetical protein